MDGETSPASPRDNRVAAPETSTPPVATSAPGQPEADPSLTPPNSKNVQRSSLIGLAVVFFLIGAASLALVYGYLRQGVSRHQPASLTSTAGWKTFRSPVSTVQFMYPSSWHLNVPPKTSNAPSSFIQGVYLNGPNGFVMYLEIDTSSADDNSSCGFYYEAKPVKLNSSHDTVLEGLNAKSIYRIYLISTLNEAAYDAAATRCPLVNYRNALGADQAYVFYGQYNNDRHNAQASSFIAQPELVTAQVIFNSFKP